MKYFRIKNFDKYQHFKKRGSVPWIRLYRSLLNDYDFTSMTESQQLNWIKILLLAAEKIIPQNTVDGSSTNHGGTVDQPSFTHQPLPADPSHIRRCINARGRIDLNIYISKGFIEVFDNKLITSEHPRAVSEAVSEAGTEGGTKEQKDRKGDRGIPFEDLSLARTMREEIFKICPDTAGPEVEQSWATEIQKMRRVKKLTTEQIVQTWDWARNDEFYCKIVSGPAELFRHWDKIRFKVNNSKKEDWRAYV